jgi:hypothetical protein
MLVVVERKWQRKICTKATFSSSTVVKYLPRHLQVQGSNPAAAAGKRKERGEKERYEKGNFFVSKVVDRICSQ